MRFARSLAVLAAGTMLTASAAFAQLHDYTPTGSNIRQTPESLDRDRRNAVFYSLSRCIYSRSRRKVDYVLRHSDDRAMDKSIENVVDYLRVDTCLGRVAGPNAVEIMGTFTTQKLRNWLAERAYLAANPVFVAPAQGATTPARTYFASPAELPQATAFAVIADCLVAQNLEGADKLLRTDWTSPEEVAAARALAPALGGCLQQGQQVSLRADDIRGFAAQGLWQKYEAGKRVTYEGRP